MCRAVFVSPCLSLTKQLSVSHLAFDFLDPFVRMLSDSDKAKLELAADMAALHHKVLELTQKLPP